MGYDGYGYAASSGSTSFASVWPIVSLILAICGAIVLYFTFLNKNNDGKYTGFLGWLYNFLTFKTITLEAILKMVYLFLAIYITLFSFELIAVNFLVFLLVLVLGNLLARVMLESSLLILLIYRQLVKIADKK